MHTLADIERETKTYSISHAKLCAAVEDLTDELAAIQRKHLAGIKRAVACAAEDKARLTALVKDSPTLFVKPRTFIFHGVKVGFAKSKGGIEISNPDRTVTLIHKQFGNEAKTYLHQVEKPNKESLETLSVHILKQLACTVRDTGDQVVIKPTDSEVEKTVAALLKDATETATEAAAA
jgi:hypothetical protein